MIFGAMEEFCSRVSKKVCERWEVGQPGGSLGVRLCEQVPIESEEEI